MAVVLIVIFSVPYYQILLIMNRRIFNDTFVDYVLVVSLAVTGVLLVYLFIELFVHGGPDNGDSNGQAGQERSGLNTQPHS